MPRPPVPPSLPEVVARLVEPLARDAADPLRRVGLAWADICGTPLWRHLEPLAVRDGTLHVGARGPVWRDAVFHERGVLAERVRRYVPSVRRIWLHTLPGDAQPPAPPPSRPALTERTAGISDPDLRLAMERLLGARRGEAGSGG